MIEAKHLGVPTRRGFIGGLIAAITAPAIVRLDNIMPVKLVDFTPPLRAAYGIVAGEMQIFDDALDQWVSIGDLASLDTDTFVNHRVTHDALRIPHVHRGLIERSLKASFYGLANPNLVKLDRVSIRARVGNEVITARDALALEHKVHARMDMPIMSDLTFSLSEKIEVEIIDDDGGTNG